MKQILTAITTFLTLIISSSSYGDDGYGFEDLVLGTTYVPGDTFVTSAIPGDPLGLPVMASDFQLSNGIWASGGFASVDNRGLAGGLGQDLSLNNINLNFMLNGYYDVLSLQFGEYGGNLNIEINGSFFNFENFADIDGMFIGGTYIHVVNGFGNDMGLLEVGGSINSFAIGGQELWIDNVKLIVPVPAAVWLFGTGIVVLVGLASHKKT